MHVNVNVNVNFNVNVNVNVNTNVCILACIYVCTFIVNEHGDIDIRPTNKRMNNGLPKKRGD